MGAILATRAAHLLPFIEVLRDIGTPMGRELARANLPQQIEEQPDRYISVLRALEFRQNCAALEKLEDLGYLAAKRHDILRLSPAFLLKTRNSPTLFDRLKRFFELIRLEDSMAFGALTPEGEHTRIDCNIPALDGVEGAQFSEWIQLAVIVELVRSGLGKSWQPVEMTFKSCFRPSCEAKGEFANTRLLTGQRRTSVLVATDLLAVPLKSLQLPHALARGAAAVPPEFGRSTNTAPGFAETLKEILKPYLPDKSISLSMAAEITGASPRTLQRRLMEKGTTYTDLVQQARFGLASELLADPDIKLIDVALSVGYDDPSHFSRSFRQICGVSPRRYRKTLLARLQSLRGALPMPGPRDQTGLNLECAFVSEDPPAAGQPEVSRPL